jgi:hypothetical protein
MSGYGLVVERILAKDKTRVRFSLPAPKFLSTKLKLYIGLEICPINKVSYITKVSQNRAYFSVLCG